LKFSTKIKQSMPFLVFILIFLAAFSGCQTNGENPTNFNPYQGTAGISLEFLKNAPPNQAYQGEQLSVVANLHNQGAYSVVKNSSQDDQIFFHLTFDNYYFRALTQEKGSIGLDGKNYYDQFGESRTLEFVLEAKELEGQRESPESQIIFNLCYPYHTKLVQDVCLDSDPFNLDQRKKTCESQTHTFTGQGAPIAVTKIEPRMSVRTDDEDNTFVSPSFTLTFQNKGTGNVISRTFEKPLEDQCSIKNTGITEFGKTGKLDVRLSRRNLVCKPDVLNFVNNEAKTTCYVEGEGQQFIPLTFVTQPDILYIDLDYIYLDAETKTVEIVR